MWAGGGGGVPGLTLALTKVTKQKGPPTESSFLPKAAYTAGIEKNLSRNIY